MSMSMSSSHCAALTHSEQVAASGLVNVCDSEEGGGKGGGVGVYGVHLSSHPGPVRSGPVRPSLNPPYLPPPVRTVFHSDSKQIRRCGLVSGGGRMGVWWREGGVSASLL